MKSRALVAILFMSLLPAVRPAEALPSVQLFTGAGRVALPEVARARVRQQAVELVQSSNFHSGPGDKYDLFTLAGVQQDYRDAVAAEYLLVTFSPARKIATAGGEVIAAEIVVGLRGQGGKNAVFTIDESGTVTGHAKYSGEGFLELKQTLAQLRR